MVILGSHTNPKAIAEFQNTYSHAAGYILNALKDKAEEIGQIYKPCVTGKEKTKTFQKKQSTRTLIGRSFNRYVGADHAFKFRGYHLSPATRGQGNWTYTRVHYEENSRSSRYHTQRHPQARIEFLIKGQTV